MDHCAGLREQVAGATNRPGVYKLRGAGDDVVYVGKSIRIRSRLLSYFRADRGDKAREILRYARGVEWEYVPDEFSALLREFRLIRRLRPVFNIEHKRERAICFVRIPREPAPRLVVARQPSPGDVRYYGPLLGIGRVRAAMRELTNILELRDCAASIPIRFGDQPDLFGHSPSPLCPRSELRRCVAPCAGGCTEREYRRKLEAAVRFLDGEGDAPLDALRERMRAAADRVHYEYAGELRDRVAALENVRDSILRTRRLLSQLNFVYAPPGHDGDDRLYILRDGRVIAELRKPGSRRGWRAIAERLDEALRAPPTRWDRTPPDQLAETLLVARWFRRRPEEMRRVAPIERTRFTAMGSVADG